MSKAEVADILEDAARGENISKFNQFACTRIEDPELEAIRNKVLTIPDRYPGGEYWCSPAGFEEMAQIAGELRRFDD